MHRGALSCLYVLQQLRDWSWFVNAPLGAPSERHGGLKTGSGRRSYSLLNLWLP